MGAVEERLLDKSSGGEAPRWERWRSCSWMGAVEELLVDGSGGGAAPRW